MKDTQAAILIIVSLVALLIRLVLYIAGVNAPDWVDLTLSIPGIVLYGWMVIEFGKATSKRAVWLFILGLSILVLAAHFWAYTPVLRGVALTVLVGVMIIPIWFLTENKTPEKGEDEPNTIE